MAMQCPICKKPSAPRIEGPANVSPFCSERCKLIDLGRWLGGKYQIPVEADDETASDVDALEPLPDDE